MNKLDKKVYKSHKTESKRKHQEIKNQYKKTRPSLKKRLGKVLNRAKYPFVVANKKIGNKIHKKRNDIKELNVKLDYIVNSLKTTILIDTTDEIRKKTIEDIVENIDDL